MIVYTLEKRWQILRHYFENHGNVAECLGKLCTNFRRREAPSAPYVGCLVKKGKETGILIEKPKRKKPNHCIRTYVISHYNRSVRCIDQVSHTTYVVCVNFIHKWRDLQSKVDFERQIF